MIDLYAFCDPSRKEVATPFTHEGFTYATNDFIVVRVQALPGITRPVPDPVKLEKVSFEPRHAGGWQAMPQLPKPEKIACGECQGLPVRQKCRACRGTGEVYRGKNPWVRLDGHIFPAGLIDLVEELPELEIFLPVHEQILNFRFKGGSGAVIAWDD